METLASKADHIARLKLELKEAVRGFSITEAEGLYQELVERHDQDPDSDAMLPSRVAIGLFRGRLLDTVCMLNALDEDRALGLKAVCLHMMDDPFWEGTAMRALSTSDDPQVRSSMQSLLDSAQRA